MNHFSAKQAAAGLLILLALASCGGGSPADGQPDPVPVQTAGDAASEQPAGNQPKAENAESPEQPAGDQPENAEQSEQKTEEADAAKEDNATENPPAEEAEAPLSAEERMAVAREYIDQPVSALIERLGEPDDRDYAKSCFGSGDDGNLYYDGFIVFTYRENGEETVRDVDVE